MVVVTVHALLLLFQFINEHLLRLWLICEEHCSLTGGISFFNFVVFLWLITFLRSLAGGLLRWELVTWKRCPLVVVAEQSYRLLIPHEEKIHFDRSHF
uniref:Uncharacterized protein n=1 Tax=Nelumbo nucifera TaxID=4432 RepID=A0A822ZSC2_NELNU|nr:TPA_asm: hypothetical protein HUJ06_002978 [Nelumbo nucifera]